MSHTELDDEIESRQKLENELEKLRADMALLQAENATYKQYGSCQDCGFPLDKIDDDDIVCHKCGEEIGDRIIAQLRAELSREEYKRLVAESRFKAAEADNAGLRGMLRDEIMRAEAAEARVRELEHDIDVDDWPAAFVHEQARAAQLEAERDAIAAENEAIHRAAVNELCGTDTSTIEAVQHVINERDELIEWRDAGEVEIEQLTAERDEVLRQLERAVSAEREACAKIADGKAGQCGLSYSDSDEDTARSNGWDWACDSIAAAIRARSNKTK